MITYFVIYIDMTTGSTRRILDTVIFFVPQNHEVVVVMDNLHMCTVPSEKKKKHFYVINITQYNITQYNIIQCMSWLSDILPRLTE